MERVTMSIKGMTYPAHVAHAEERMRDQDGVVWATINYAAQEVLIVYDPTTFSMVKLADAVHEMGYELSLDVEQLTALKARIPTQRLPPRTGTGNREWRP